MSQRFEFRLREELAEKLDRFTETTHRTRASVVTEALAAFLDLQLSPRLLTNKPEAPPKTQLEVKPPAQPQRFDRGPRRIR